MRLPWRVWSSDQLKKDGYPGEPSQPFYLVYDVVPAVGFEGYEWDYSPVLHFRLETAPPIGRTPNNYPRCADGGSGAEFVGEFIEP
jgi:hypothetical protein